MYTIDPRRFGFALGATWSLLYLGCAFMMAVLPRESAISFANMLVHGVDWGPIVNWEKSWASTLMGVVCVFIVGWLVGARSLRSTTSPRQQPARAMLRHQAASADSRPSSPVPSRRNAWTIRTATTTTEVVTTTSTPRWPPIRLRRSVWTCRSKG